MKITMDMMAPAMFAGLVLIMLVGFPVAFSLAALGFDPAEQPVDFSLYETI